MYLLPLWHIPKKLIDQWNEMCKRAKFYRFIHNKNKFFNPIPSSCVVGIVKSGYPII